MQVENVGLQQVHTSNADGPQRTALPPHYTYERAITNKVWRIKHPTLSLYGQQRTRDTHTAAYKRTVVSMTGRKISTL